MDGKGLQLLHNKVFTVVKGSEIISTLLLLT